MDPNPYDAPRSEDPYARGDGVAFDRTPFVLAAIGAGLASAYWALLTLLIGAGVSAGGGSPAQLILPVVLIGLYAFRGLKVWRGDANAARSLLWLHGLGGVVAVMQAMALSGLMATLQGMKLLIHVFGGVTAFLAVRAARNLGR
jgi:hypothetical protein